MIRLGAALTAALLVSACSGGAASGSYIRSTPPPAASAPPSSEARAAFRAPQVMQGQGLDSIMGARAPALTDRFGAPRIDRVEGDARKLQFVSERCVLDIYLYPLEANGVPVATHVETRERNGGAETDHARCIAEIDAGRG